MRKLVWFSLGFGAACCLCAYVITGSTRVILAAAVGFLTLFAAIAGRKFALFRRIAAVLLGFATGMGWFILYDGFYLNAAGTMDGKTANAVIRVSDYSYETAYGIGVDGSVQLEGKNAVRTYTEKCSPRTKSADCIRGLGTREKQFNYSYCGRRRTRHSRRSYRRRRTFPVFYRASYCG